MGVFLSRKGKSVRNENVSQAFNPLVSVLPNSKPKVNETQGNINYQNYSFVYDKITQDKNKFTFHIIEQNVLGRMFKVHPFCVKDELVIEMKLKYIGIGRYKGTYSNLLKSKVDSVGTVDGIEYNIRKDNSIITISDMTEPKVEKRNEKIENGKIVLKYKESEKEAYSFTTKYDRIENFEDTWIIYTKTPYFMFCNNQIRITTKLDLFQDCEGEGKMHGMRIRIIKNKNEIAITILDVSYTQNSEDIGYRF